VPTGTGNTTEGEYVKNIGLPQLLSDDWLDMVKEGLKWADNFDPDLLLVSCGLDGLEGDTGNYKLGHLLPQDYGHAMRLLLEWANRPGKRCQGKVLAVLEGGYKVTGGMVSDLATAVAHVVREMIDAGRKYHPSSSSSSSSSSGSSHPTSSIRTGSSGTSSSTSNGWDTRTSEPDLSSGPDLLRPAALPPVAGVTSPPIL